MNRNTISFKFMDDSERVMRGRIRKLGPKRKRSEFGNSWEIQDFQIICCQMFLILFLSGTNVLYFF